MFIYTLVLQFVTFGPLNKIYLKEVTFLLILHFLASDILNWTKSNFCLGFENILYDVADERIETNT